MKYYRYYRCSKLQRILACSIALLGTNLTLDAASLRVTAILKYEQQQWAGQVHDEMGKPLPNASVRLRGNQLVVQTDVNGKFKIQARENDVIEISLVGFRSKSVVIGASASLTVRLERMDQSLDEVVVVGYGTQKKGNLTSAISTIQSKDIPTTTNASLAQMLQGKIPGLQIRQTSAEPGTFSNTINIRGFGEPLYVIDGIVRDGGTEFQQLNPNDIENISVLKDASAAVYGLNAANGVIVVTTKKGQSGKPVFNYTGAVGAQTPTDRPIMANAAQYLQMYDDAVFFRDGTHPISQAEIERWKTGGTGYESTDWYNETFKKASVQQQHDLSVRGGTDKINFFSSLGYYNENGMFKSGDMKYNRYNFRTNLTAKLSDNMKLDVLFAGRRSKRIYPGGDGFIWMYKGTIISLPTEGPYIQDNPQYPANIANQQNAVIMSQRDYAGYTEEKGKNIQSSIVLTYDVPFVNGLKASGTLSYDNNGSFNKSVWKNYKVFDKDLNGILLNNPRIANDTKDAERFVLQAQLDYNRSFAEDHHVSATAVYEQKSFVMKHAHLYREYEFYTTDIVDYASGKQTNNGDELEERNMSYIGRLNYDFKNKYLLGATFRYDGSYRYAPGKRWGFFPGVSVGWRISEEPFIKNNLPFISNFKLRGSYGVIGENVGDAFQFVLGFSSLPNAGSEFVNGAYVGGLGAPGVINPNFTWVKSKHKDIGIEASFWNGKLSVEADYYERLKSGKLKVRNEGLPNTFGGSMPIENLESDLTRGFDFVVTHQNKVNELGYTISFNMNLARTMFKVVDKPEARSSNDRWRNGLVDRWNDFVWGYTHTGQFQNSNEIHQAIVYDEVRGNAQLLPGDYSYADINGDGLINAKDMLPIFQDQHPKMFYGLTLSANYKNVDFTTVLQGAAKYTMRFNEVFSQMFFNNGNLPAYFYDRWHLADPYDPNSDWVAGTWPANRYAEFMQSSYRESNVWRKNATYLRVKSVELGYKLSLGERVSKHIKGIRIYANAFNLFTFANSFVRQFDPEGYEANYQSGYNYPVIKSYNLGVNVSF
jgi:TonB-linked SusC/RagA family outer membrane protein